MSQPNIIAKSQQSQLAPATRILSIDALRGFDMFWIIGGALLFPALDQIFQSPITAWLSLQSHHSDWDQPHLLDIIFPLFLFIVGIVLPISIDRQRSQNLSLAKIHAHTARRAIILIILGLLSKGLLLTFTLKFSVLSRIGFSYYIAALLVIHTTWRFQAIFTAALLTAAALMMTLIPIHGSTYINKDIASTFPLIAECVRWVLSVPSVLFGVLAGHYLRTSHTGPRKTLTLALAGLLCIILSLAIERYIPRIFFLWTSSFVVYTAGISLMLMALFYWIIDVKGCRKWSFFFTVIGMNSILIYFISVSHIIDFQKIADFLILAAAHHCGLFKDLILTADMLACQVSIAIRQNCS